MKDDIVLFELHGYADSPKGSYAVVTFVLRGHLVIMQVINAKSKIVPAKITCILRFE